MCREAEDASYRAEHNLSEPLVFHSGTDCGRCASECKREERRQRWAAEKLDEPVVDGGGPGVRGIGYGRQSQERETGSA
jgi:hypothetical protein